jgi:hypothetical protein
VKIEARRTEEIYAGYRLVLRICIHFRHVHSPDPSHFPNNFLIDKKGRHRIVTKADNALKKTNRITHVFSALCPYRWCDAWQ